MSNLDGRKARGYVASGFIKIAHYTWRLTKAGRKELARLERLMLVGALAAAIGCNGAVVGSTSASPSGTGAGGGTSDAGAGEGGAGGTSSSSSASSASGSASGSDAGSDGGDADECRSWTDCPLTPECILPACVRGACALEPAPNGSLCSDNADGGAGMSVCIDGVCL